jgi:hypothetical protein
MSRNRRNTSKRQNGCNFQVLKGGILLTKTENQDEVDEFDKAEG